VTARLRTKVVLAFLAVSLCPVALIAYRDSEITRNALTQSAYRSLSTAASQTAIRLDTFIAATANVVGTQAKMPTLAEYLSDPAGAQAKTKERVVDILHTFAAKNAAFTSSVAVLDLHGRILLDTQPSSVGRDESATQYFRSALETGLPHASGLEFSPIDGKPYLNFTSTVTTPDGRPVGVLRERYSGAILQYMVVENNQLVGPQSFAIVLRDDGLLLADGHLSPGQLADGVFELNRPIPFADKALAQAGRPRSNFTLRLSKDARPWHAAVSSMTTQPWTVIFLQPQDVFLAPIRAQMRDTVVLALVIVAAVAAAAIGGAQLLTRPIVRLMAAARRVAEGHFEGKVTVRSRDEIGALANAFNLMTDRLKATVDGLRRSEENYRGIYENALEGMWRVSHDGRVLSANPAMARILGYASPDDLIASLTDIGRQLYVHPLERDAVLRAYAEGTAIEGRELEFYRNDGTRIWVLTSARPVHDDAGRFLFAEGFVTDITRRKRAEEELRRSAAYMTAAQPLSRTGSFGWHISTGKIYWSAETFRIFDCDRAREPTIEFVSERTHPDDRALVRHVIAQAEQEGINFDCEHRLLLPDGSVRYLHVVAHALEKAESGDLEFVGAIMDVTERKRAEEALHRTQAELAHVSRVTTLGELAASIAHETNQPLAAIVANAGACLNWLAAADPELEQVRDVLNAIVTDGHRAGDVIQRIRQLATKTDPCRGPLDLNDVIRGVIPLILTEVRQHQVSLRMELTPALPSVLGDHVQVQQVIINLMINGIEAMTPVTDRTRELVIRSRPHDGNQVLVTVEDAGIGIDAANMDQLYDAFFTTKPGGMGMGLSISRSIIQGHGGQLWAAPNPTHGTTFHFSVPVMATSAAVVEATVHRERTRRANSEHVHSD
jgi:PAS domain S-box-containing protein